MNLMLLNSGISKYCLHYLAQAQVLYKFSCQDNSPSPALLRELGSTLSCLELPKGEMQHCQAALLHTATGWGLLAQLST